MDENEILHIYKSRKHDLIKYLEELIQNIKSFKEIRATVFGLSIGSTYRLIATYWLLEGNVFKSKINFFKDSKVTSEAFNIFRDNQYRNIKKTETPPFTGLFANSFISTIVADNKEQLNSFVNSIYDSGNLYPPFNYEITSAMKYLILKDYDKAIFHANNAHQQKYFKLPYKGFSHVVKGILDKDIDLINEGLALRIKHHKRENKDSIFYSISLEATALAKLAIKYDLQPDTSSSFIHKELLKEHKDIQYEGIDEIIEALEIANKRNGSIYSKVIEFFKK